MRERLRRLIDDKDQDERMESMRRLKRVGKGTSSFDKTLLSWLKAWRKRLRLSLHLLPCQITADTKLAYLVEL